VTAALRADSTALDAVTTLMSADGTDAGPTRRYVVLPHRDRPRYIVPVAARFARAAHVRPGSGVRAAIARTAVRSVLATGAGRVLPGRVDVVDGTDERPGLRRHLAALVGRDDVDLVLALGAPRPNRKPVIQVVDGDGATVAWAKVGVDAHTDRLVGHETEALGRVDPDGPIAVPRVVAAGAWQGHRLLLLAPLRVEESLEPLDVTAAVVRAIAGPVASAPVSTGAWAATLAEQVRDDGAARKVVTTVLGRLGGRTWAFGAWHGDLAPWNATWEGDRLHVWDWERSTAPVPLGLDAVHNAFQQAALGGGDPVAAAAAAARGAAPTLHALGYDADDVVPVVWAYLATLRARYAEDARLGPLGPGERIAAAIDRDPILGLEGPA